MAVIYRHGYADVSVYGHVVALLRNAGLGRGVHVDIGCGYGAIAEPISEQLKLDYVGFDLADDGLADLRARGFAAEPIDLLRPDLAEQTIRSAVGDRKIASITILDTLEHLANGQDVLAMLRRIAGDSGSLLVISVPNVNHKDIALKSLAGRWDVTEAGLLDYTHVDLYNSERLALRTAVSGWEQVDRNDWLLEKSDQYFPPDLPLLDIASPLGGHLRDLIEQANPDLLVNQFVRAFRPVAPAEIATFIEPGPAQEPDLSVVVLVRDEDGLASVLDALARQSHDDFEAIFLLASPALRAEQAEARIRAKLNAGQRIKILALPKAGDGEAYAAGVGRATGSHVAFVPPQTVPADGWAAGLLSALSAHPRRVAWLSHGDVPGRRLSPFLEPDQAVAEFAVPRLALTELGLVSKVARAGAEVQTVITHAILACGMEVVSSAEQVLLGKPHGNTIDPVPEAILWYLNTRPIVVPPGTALEVEHLVQGFRHAQRNLQLLTLFPLVREFAHPYLEALQSAPLFVEDGTERPFLSIVTRTQGTRLDTLSDMLLSLAGQSSTNFESVIVVHSSEASVMARVAELVKEFPSSLSDRVRLHQCTRAGRAAPLNDGVAVARGQYVSVLDDDDFVFGHYVETFEKLGSSRPGNLLRASCARQQFEHTGEGDAAGSRAQSWFDMEWPSNYDAVAHLGVNYTPFMSIAFPRVVFDTLKLRFDESLTTLEDWQLTTKAASLCGVATSPEVTSVYRWWTNANSSLFAHSASEWSDNRQRVVEDGNNRPLLLPSGARASIVAMAERCDALDREVADLRHRNSELGQQNVELGQRNSELADRELNWDTEIRSSLRQHLDSTSWRVTRPFRRLVAIITGRPADGVELPPASTQEAWQRLQLIQGSTSWKLAAPIRLAGRLLRTRPRPAVPGALEGDAVIEAARLHLASTSWRVTKPIRIVGARLRGQPGPGHGVDKLPATSDEAQRVLHDIRSSTSWRITAPLRLLGRLAGRGHRPPGSAG